MAHLLRTDKSTRRISSVKSLFVAFIHSDQLFGGEAVRGGKMGFRRVASLAAFLVVLGQAASQSSTTSSSCTTTSSLKTLLSSTNCSSACSTTDLCIFTTPEDNSSSSGLSNTCSNESGDVECVQTDDSCEIACVDTPLGEFTLLVPFGTYQSNEEQELRSLYGDDAVDRALASFGDDTSSYLTISNDVMTSVGAISLDSTVQTL